MPGPFDGAPSDARALDRRAPEGTPRGVVLVLHGGTPHSLEPVGTRSGSLWRMQVLRNALQRDVLGAGHALWLLRYARRGWNGGTTRSPVPDARWALDQVRAAYGDEDAVLVGHGTAWTVLVAALTGAQPDLERWRALQMPDLIMVEPLRST